MKNRKKAAMGCDLEFPKTCERRIRIHFLVGASHRQQFSGNESFGPMASRVRSGRVPVRSLTSLLHEGQIPFLEGTTRTKQCGHSSVIKGTRERLTMTQAQRPRSRPRRLHGGGKKEAGSSRRDVRSAAAHGWRRVHRSSIASKESAASWSVGWRPTNSRNELTNACSSALPRGNLRAPGNVG